MPGTYKRVCKQFGPFLEVQSQSGTPSMNRIFSSFFFIVREITAPKHVFFRKKNYTKAPRRVIFQPNIADGLKNILYHITESKNIMKMRQTTSPGAAQIYCKPRPKWPKNHCKPPLVGVCSKISIFFRVPWWVKKPEKLNRGVPWVKNLDSPKISLRGHV